VACVWLDVIGGSGIASIGLARAKENDLPFTFKDETGATVFSNDFTYDPKSDSWKWEMAEVHDGKASRFGTEKLVKSGPAEKWPFSGANQRGASADRLCSTLPT
jgi:hypothetical protein